MKEAEINDWNDLERVSSYYIDTAQAWVTSIVDRLDKTHSQDELNKIQVLLKSSKKSVQNLKQLLTSEDVQDNLGNEMKIQRITSLLDLIIMQIKILETDIKKRKNSLHFSFLKRCVCL